MVKARRRSKSRPRSKPGPLTRERVLNEALVILDRDGIEALTIRRLAGELGVSPMALYNHVSSKADILQGVAWNLLEGANFSSDHSNWRERIRACYRELRNSCLAHPGAVRLLETIDVAPISIFGPMEIVIAALDDIGMSKDDALRAYCLLTNFTLGQVSYELRGPLKGFNLTEHPERGKLRAAGLPHVERMALVEDWDFGRAFEFGLSVILDGLGNRVPDSPSANSNH